MLEIADILVYPCSTEQQDIHLFHSCTPRHTPDGENEIEDLSQERRKMRARFGDQEFGKMVQRSREILKEYETYQLHQIEKHEKLGFYMSNINYHRKRGAVGVNIQYINKLKDAIYKSRLRHGGGLIIGIEVFSDPEMMDLLIQAMISGIKIAVFCSPDNENYKHVLTAINAAISENICIESIPGFCRDTFALSSSGFPANEFYCLGFLPTDPEAMRKELKTAISYNTTTLIKCHPDLLQKTLHHLIECYGPRHLCYITSPLYTEGLSFRAELSDLLSDLSIDFTSLCYLLLPPLTSTYNKGLILEENTKVGTSSSLETISLNPIEILGVLDQELDIDDEGLVQALQEILNVRPQEAREIFKAWEINSRRAEGNWL